MYGLGGSISSKNNANLRQSRRRFRELGRQTLPPIKYSEEEKRVLKQSTFIQRKKRVSDKELEMDIWIVLFAFGVGIGGVLIWLFL